MVYSRPPVAIVKAGAKGILPAKTFHRRLFYDEIADHRDHHAKFQFFSLVAIARLSEDVDTSAEEPQWFQYGMEGAV